MQITLTSLYMALNEMFYIDTQKTKYLQYNIYERHNNSKIISRKQL